MAKAVSKIHPWKPEAEYPYCAVVWHAGSTWKARNRVAPFVKPEYCIDESCPWEESERHVIVQMTRKPCPKCNATSWRPAGRVCDACVRQIIDDHETMMAMRASLDAGRVQVDLNKIPWFDDQYEDYRVNCLSDALQDLARSVSTPVDKVDFEQLEALVVGSYSSRDNRDVVEVSLPFLAAFREVFFQLLKFSERRYNNGRRRGSNLLVGLATGEVSVSDYNEFTIYPKGRENGSSSDAE